MTNISHLVYAMKKKTKKNRITVEDYILAQRRASRELELALHGRQISGRRMLHRSKKTYSRKNRKPVDIDE